MKFRLMEAYVVRLYLKIFWGKSPCYCVLPLPIINEILHEILYNGGQSQEVAFFKISGGWLPLYRVLPQSQPTINRSAVANHLRCTLMYYISTSIYVLLHFLMRGFICSRYTSYYTIHYSTQHVHNIYTMVSWWNWLFAHAIIWPTDTTGTMLLVLYYHLCCTSLRYSFLALVLLFTTVLNMFIMFIPWYHG